MAAREAPVVIKTLCNSADILCQAWKDIGRKDLSLVAAGVTYYLLVALFPALAALISVYGLVENPAGMTKDVQSLSSLLPPSIVRLASAALRELISASIGSLSLGAIIGIGIAEAYAVVPGAPGFPTAGAISGAISSSWRGEPGARPSSLSACRRD